MYVYTYTCIYVCVCVCVYIYICVYYTYAHTFVPEFPDRGFLLASGFSPAACEVAARSRAYPYTQGREIAMPPNKLRTRPQGGIQGFQKACGKKVSNWVALLVCLTLLV